MEHLEIVYKGQRVNVQILDIGTQRIYKVNLPSATPLLITRAKNADGVYFWTSVPEGKQQMAVEIGTLIEPILKSP